MRPWPWPTSRRSPGCASAARVPPAARASAGMPTRASLAPGGCRPTSCPATPRPASSCASGSTRQPSQKPDGTFPSLKVDTRGQAIGYGGNASNSRDPHIEGRQADKIVLVLFGCWLSARQRSRQPERWEHAVVEAGHGADPVAGEGEHVQAGPVADAVEAAQVGPEGRLAVGVLNGEVVKEVTTLKQQIDGHQDRGAWPSSCQSTHRHYRRCHQGERRLRLKQKREMNARYKPAGDDT